MPVRDYYVRWDEQSTLELAVLVFAVRFVDAAAVVVRRDSGTLPHSHRRAHQRCLALAEDDSTERRAVRSLRSSPLLTRAELSLDAAAVEFVSAVESAERSYQLPRAPEVPVKSVK